MLLRSTILVAFALLNCAGAQAQWPPEDAATELPLLPPSEGDVEIRVWLGGGVTQPSELYRVKKAGQTVEVEAISWAPVVHAVKDVYTERQAHRETRKLRQFMEKYGTGCKVTQTTHFLWCKLPVNAQGAWSVLFDDLMPDELWALPTELTRNCGWVQDDGEIVRIDILSGDRLHSVSYGNPDFCCHDVPCAIADHVRRVVRNIK